MRGCSIRRQGGLQPPPPPTPCKTCISRTHSTLQFKREKSPFLIVGSHATSEFQVFYFCLFILQFTYFSCVSGFSYFVFQVLLFRCSGVSVFRHSGVPCFSTSPKFAPTKFSHTSTQLDQVRPQPDRDAYRDLSFYPLHY